MEPIFNLALGLIAGGFIAGIGYFKELAKKKGDSFMLDKFLLTVGIGAGFGILANLTGLPDDAIFSLLIIGGATSFTNDSAKVVREILKK